MIEEIQSLVSKLKALDDGETLLNMAEDDLATCIKFMYSHDTDPKDVVGLWYFLLMRVNERCMEIIRANCTKCLIECMFDFDDIGATCE